METVAYYLKCKNLSGYNTDSLIYYKNIADLTTLKIIIIIIIIINNYSPKWR